MKDTFITILQFSAFASLGLFTIAMAWYVIVYTYYLMTGIKPI